MKKTFKPTQAQIDAAQDVFIAMAFHQIAKKKFDEFEIEILNTRQYHYSDSYYTEEVWIKRDLGLPSDKVLTNPKHLHMMEGLGRIGECIDGDAKRFYEELGRIATLNGFANAENSECMAENDLIKAENKLLSEVKNITGINVGDIVYMEHREKLLDLTLNLFGALVDQNPNKEEKFNKYYNERMITSVLQ